MKTRGVKKRIIEDRVHGILKEADRVSDRLEVMIKSVIKLHEELIEAIEKSKDLLIQRELTGKL